MRTVLLWGTGEKADLMDPLNNINMYFFPAKASYTTLHPYQELTTWYSALSKSMISWAVSQVKGIMGACGEVIHEQEMTNHFLWHNTIQKFTKKVSSVQNATMVQLLTSSVMVSAGWNRNVSDELSQLIWQDTKTSLIQIPKITCWTRIQTCAWSLPLWDAPKSILIMNYLLTVTQKTCS